MPVAWFIAPYERKDRGVVIETYYRRGLACAMDEYTATLVAEGGTWDCLELRGGFAACKVRASLATLATIADDARMRRFPKSVLDETFMDQTPAVKVALRQVALDCGYTGPEVAAAFPNGVGDATLAQLLRFLALGRRKVRDAGGTLVFDGAVVGPAQAVEDIDGAVVNGGR